MANGKAAMKVTCLQCGQHYHLTPEHIPPGKTTAKCKRCGGVVPLQTSPATVSAPPAKTAPAPRALHFLSILAALVTGLAGGYVGAFFLAEQAHPPPLSAAPNPSSAPLSPLQQAQAQLELEDIYALGKYTFPRNPDQGIHWISVAAAAGERNAQYSLYVLYRKEKGVPNSAKIPTPNHAAALAWLEKSAENGLPMAQLTLFSAYTEGKLGEDKQRRAKDWLRQAIAGYQRHAEAGDPEALFMLGLLHNGGVMNIDLTIVHEIMPPDLDKAVALFAQAKELGIDDSDALQILLTQRYGEIF
jgi:TPR repeat protein